MSDKLLYREQLDRVVCNSPNCRHGPNEHRMFMHSGCHPKAPTWSSYFDGVFTVTCAECDAIVCEIAVARRADDR